MSIILLVFFLHFKINFFIFFIYVCLTELTAAFQFSGLHAVVPGRLDYVYVEIKYTTALGPGYGSESTLTLRRLTYNVNIDGKSHIAVRSEFC